MLKYGLKNKKTGKIIGFRTEFNGDDADGNSTSYYLDENSDKMWLVDSAIQAEFARKINTRWYNAGYDTPGNYFDEDCLEVVSVEVIVKTEPVEVHLPTPEEYWKDNPYILEELKKGIKHQYSYHDYLFRNMNIPQAFK